MDHNGIGSGLHKCKCAFQSVVHTLFQYEALNPGANHKVFCFLGFFTGFDLLAEVLNRILLLLDLCAEQGVFLQSDLVFYDDHRNPHTLKRTDGIDKMLGLSAGVAVEYYGFGGHLHYIIDGTEAAGHVNNLNIRFPFGRGVAKRA